MILYCDSSALIKRYVSEQGSLEIRPAMDKAEAVGINTIGCVEVVATFAKFVLMRRITESRGLRLVIAFQEDRSAFVVSELIPETFRLAEKFAWSYRLRGYDSVHLASARLWQNFLDVPVTLATFDESLWRAANLAGLSVFPENLPVMLQLWR